MEAPLPHTLIVPYAEYDLLVCPQRDALGIDKRRRVCYDKGNCRQSSGLRVTALLRWKPAILCQGVRGFRTFRGGYAAFTPPPAVIRILAQVWAVA